MELKTVSQVSKQYGVSTRMLRYYEEIGLLQSLRKEDYSYRVYDEDMLKRLQQIIILRKLQIPVKKISVILNNTETAAVIEIFKENISEMEKEMSALSTIKFILEKFVSDIEKITAVQMNLDILNDDSVQKMAESLSLVQKNIKESFMSMNELNQAAEILSQRDGGKVRVIHIPRMTVVEVGCTKHSPSQNYHNIEFIKDPCQRIASNVRDVLKKFIDDVDLFTIKPDTRIFGCGNEGPNSEGDWEGDFCMWASIPDDLDVPFPLKKREFYGGLYAACANSQYSIEDYRAGRMGDLECYRIMSEWADEHDDEYSDDNGGIERPACEEFFNIANIYASRLKKM